MYWMGILKQIGTWIGILKNIAPDSLLDFLKTLLHDLKFWLKADKIIGVSEIFLLQMKIVLDVLSKVFVMLKKEIH
jgi:hypothetical protein